MRVTCFASGSSGNCALLSAGGSHILLDAGISFRRIRENLALSGLAPEALSAILITHEHSDHIGGLASLVKRCEIPVCAPRTVAGHLHRTVAGVEKCLRVLPEETVEMDSFRLRWFHTPHDTEESVGWRIESDEGCFALATDMGCVTEEIRAGLSGADVVLIEANHDEEMLRCGPYPAALKRRILSDHGHLSNEACGALAAYLADRGTKQIILGHLSRENNPPEQAFRAVKAALGDRDTGLFVAPPAERLTLEYEKERPCLVSP